MTDDRDDKVGGQDAFDWDALLNNAFTDFMFKAAEPESVVGTPADLTHAVIDALIHSPSAAPLGSPGAVSVWVANDAEAPVGFGRIMFRRNAIAMAQNELAGVVAPDSPLINANMVIASGHAANDNGTWIGASDIDNLGGDNLSGVFGRDPSVAVLDNGDALIAWIGSDDSVHANFMPADESAGDTHDAASRAKLDQLLSGLGDAAAAAGGKAGRVVVTPVGQNSFAALWTNEFALNSVLMGAILTLGSAAKADGKDDAADDVTWSIKDIPPQPVPSGSVVFTVAVTDAGALTVAYHDAAGSQSNGGASDHTTVLHIQTDDETSIETVALVADDSAAGAPSSSAPTPPLNPAHRHADDADAPADIITYHSDGAKAADGQNGASNGNGQSSDGGASGHHANVSVAVADNGTVFVANVADGKLTISQTNANGHASGPDIVINNVSDAAITGTHDGVAATYVTTPGAAGPDAAPQVLVQAFTSDAQPVSSAPVVVATAQSSTTTFSDIATGYTHKDAAPATTGQAASAPAEQTTPAATAETAPAAPHDAGGVLAVAFIENADASGFGTLIAQYIAVSDDGASGHGLTALGADGVEGGDNDGAFEMTPDGNCRAPVIEGLDHGSLAVAWVQQSNDGSGPETVHGVIVTPGEDVAPEQLDLSSLMPDGIAAGTDPVLTSDDAGDLIVGWIRALLSGGYEAQSAIYRHTGHHEWAPPASAITLAHFDGLPRDFAIAVSGSGDSLSLAIAWRDGDNTVSTIRYDVGSGQADAPVVAHSDSSHSDDQGLGLSALPDGQVLVVYNNSDGGNDTSLASIVVQANSADGTAVASSGNDNSGNSDSDHSGQGSGGVDNRGSGHGSDGDGGNIDPPVSADASVQVQNMDAGSSFASAIVNFASDLIQFVTAQDDTGLVSASDLVISVPAASSLDAAAAPTLGDVAALEAFALPALNSDVQSKSSSGSGNSGSSDTSIVDDHSGSNDSGGGSDPHASGSSGTGKDSHNSVGHDSDSSDSDSLDDGSANDNSAIHLTDAPLAIATGYGNDIADYISPDEQAALVPEPVSILFEALQFANAFNDVANSEVMLFDTSNVVTISQFQSDDHGHGYIIPLI